MRMRAMIFAVTHLSTSLSLCPKPGRESAGKLGKDKLVNLFTSARLSITDRCYNRKPISMKCQVVTKFVLGISEWLGAIDKVAVSNDVV